MKRTFLILALAVMGTGVASANTNITTFIQQGQGQGPQGTPEERATAMTSRMNEVLTLTAEQTPKIQAINLKRVNEQMALREKMQGGDREAMMTQMRTLTEKYNAEFKAVLTPDQYTKYEANMAQFRGGRGGGQGGQAGGQRQGGNQR